MAIQDTDKILVNRAGKSYWMLASDLKASTRQARLDSAKEAIQTKAKNKKEK